MCACMKCVNYVIFFQNCVTTLPLVHINFMKKNINI